MKHFSYILLTLILSLSLTSCHDQPEYEDTMLGNFDALADIIDRQYCFFADKDIDWNEVTQRYREEITEETNYIELYYICCRMLDELKDGHVNLTSRFSTSYYRQWWSDYDQNFNMRTVEEYYLNTNGDWNWLTTSGIMYNIIKNEIGYMYYPSFSTTISDSSLDYVLAGLAPSRGLIIDIRDNGGGALTNINTLVGRFIDHKITGGYIQHKTGPGHNDFSKPYPIEYEPAENGRVKWLKRPIVVLTNRSCFSAANAFVAVMKTLPNVTIVGAKTGGGGGLPFTSEIPIGWSVRFSACPILDADGNIIENGIEPSPGCDLTFPEEDYANGVDPILEFAIDMLKEYPLPYPTPDDSGEEGNEEDPEEIIPQP